MEGHLEWTMAAPLWQFTGDPQNAGDRRQFRTPTILRFASDSFMPQFLDLLNTEPQRLNEFVAAPETWSSPPNEPVAPASQSGLALVLFRARNAAVRKLQAQGTRVLGQLPATVPGKVLKLYQPSHGRFYMIATCLVCRVLGLPDRRIDAGAQEMVSFVIRLLQPHAGADPQNPDPQQCDEFALVNGAWQALTDPATLASGEEQKPLAPAGYVADDLRNRRLLVGLVPVGDRERLLQATQPNPAGAPPAPPQVDARQMLLKTQVIYPLSTLEDIADRAVTDATSQNPQAPPTIDQANAQAKAMVVVANNRIQAVSYYVLLDMGKFFTANLPNIASAIATGNVSNLSIAEKAVWNTLSQASDSSHTLVQALQLASAAESKLESATTTYQPGDTNWPGFQFQFYRVTYIDGPNGRLGTTSSSSAMDRAALEQQIVAAMPAANPNPPLPTRTVAQASANPQQPVWFTMRCVLERPNCGALTPPFVSEATVAFQMAAYFDPDAPSRPIRIGLPVDTTPAGLRKFDKNTAFVMSDALCGQVSKMSGISFADLIMSVLPFPLHKDLNTGDMEPCSGGGRVCSFSIPIITIVALILLIIFVKLLDIIFFWMPFFQICLPLPNFSAKES